MAVDTGPLPKPSKKTKKRTSWKTRGKRTIEYEKWRATVAIPYLDSQGPRTCAKGCGTAWPLDVGHIQSRGAHPELRMVLTNIEWQCQSFNRLGKCMLI